MAIAITDYRFGQYSVEQFGVSAFGIITTRNLLTSQLNLSNRLSWLSTTSTGVVIDAGATPITAAGQIASLDYMVKIESQPKLLNAMTGVVIPAGDTLEMLYSTSLVNNFVRVLAASPTSSNTYLVRLYNNLTATGTDYIELSGQTLATAVSPFTYTLNTWQDNFFNPASVGNGVAFAGTALTDTATFLGNINSIAIENTGAGILRVSTIETAPSISSFVGQLIINPLACINEQELTDEISTADVLCSGSVEDTVAESDNVEFRFKGTKTNMFTEASAKGELPKIVDSFRIETDIVTIGSNGQANLPVGTNVWSFYLDNTPLQTVLVDQAFTADAVGLNEVYYEFKTGILTFSQQLAGKTVLINKQVPAKRTVFERKALKLNGKGYLLIRKKKLNSDQYQELYFRNAQIISSTESSGTSSEHEYTVKAFKYTSPYKEGNLGSREVIYEVLE